MAEKLFYKITIMKKVMLLSAVYMCMHGYPAFSQSEDLSVRIDQKTFNAGSVLWYDGTNGELTVRWPIHSPDGEVVITFNETCVSISMTGNVTDGWLLELSSDKKAKLPFGIIDRKKLSCTYKNIPYTILTKQGVFTNEPDSGLRIIPEDQCIVFDFSTIEKSM